MSLFVLGDNTIPPTIVFHLLHQEYRAMLSDGTLQRHETRSCHPKTRFLYRIGWRLQGLLVMFYIQVPFSSTQAGSEDLLHLESCQAKY